MDRLAAAEAEFGTMSISSPLLAKPQDYFSFDLSDGANQFYNDAKNSRQGSVSEFLQSALSMGAGLNATFNPAAEAAYLAQVQQYEQAVSRNNEAQASSDRKAAAQNAAVEAQYQADLAAAAQETDAAKRTQKTADAQAKRANSLVAQSPTTLPAFPTPAAQPSAPTNLVKPPTELRALFAGQGNFAGFQGLATTRPLTVTDRTAILRTRAKIT